jgi:hypothetical protein
MAIGGAYLWRQGEDDESVRVITGVQFPYPSGWTEQPLTPDDRNAGLVLRLEHGDPAASFLARTVIARLPEGLDMTELGAQTEAALAAEVEGFELVSTEIVTVGDYQGAEITYAQTDEDPAGHWVRMTIVPTENQTFYLTLRTAGEGPSSVRNDGRQMVEDFAAYVNSASNK